MIDLNSVSDLKWFSLVLGISTAIMVIGTLFILKILDKWCVLRYCKECQKVINEFNKKYDR